MNARALARRIRRRLRHRRVVVLVVSIPRSALPPRPDFDPPGEPTGTTGRWRRFHEDGSVTHYEICEAHTSRRTTRPDFTLHETVYGEDDHRAWRGIWRRVPRDSDADRQAHTSALFGNGLLEKDPYAPAKKGVTEGLLPIETVASYRERAVWYDRLSGDRPADNPIVRAALAMSWKGKALWPRVTRDAVLLGFRLHLSQDAGAVASAARRVVAAGRRLGAKIAIRVDDYR